MMDRTDIADKVSKNRKFFSNEWDCFCEWVEDCAEELARHQQHQIDKRAGISKQLAAEEERLLSHDKSKDAYLGNLARLAKCHALRWRLKCIGEQQEQLYAECGWVKWSSYDLDPECYATTCLRLQPWFVFCASPDLVNPVNWIIGRRNPRWPNEEESPFLAYARLVMAYDSTVAEANRICQPQRYEKGYFDAGRLYEDLGDHVAAMENNGDLAAAWEEVRPSLEQLPAGGQKGSSAGPAAATTETPQGQDAGDPSTNQRRKETKKRKDAFREKSVDIQKWFGKQPACKEALKRHVRAFTEAHEAYRKRLAQELANPERITGEDGPGEEWQRVVLQPYEIAALNDENIDGFIVNYPKDALAVILWVKAPPFDPLGWTISRYGSRFYDTRCERPFQPADPETSKESLKCDCALIATIWARGKNRPACDYDDFMPVGAHEWPDHLWDAINVADGGYDEDYGEKTSRILDAWERVKNDLEAEASGTPRTPPPPKTQGDGDPYRTVQRTADELVKRHPWLPAVFEEQATRFRALFGKRQSFQNWRFQRMDADTEQPLSEGHRWHAEEPEPPCPVTRDGLANEEDKTCCLYVTVGVIRDALHGTDDPKPLVKHILQDGDQSKDAYLSMLYLIGEEGLKKRARGDDAGAPEYKHLVYAPEKILDALAFVEQDVARRADHLSSATRAVPMDGGRERQGGGTDGGDEEPRPDNVFQKKGDRWELSFRGCEPFFVEDIDGMTYVHHLLGQQGKDVPAVDVYQAAHPPPPRSKGSEESRAHDEDGSIGNGEPVDQAADTELLAAYDKGLKELKQKMEQAEKDGDFAAQAQAEKQYRAIRAKAGEVMRPKKGQGRISRRFETGAHRMANCIRKAFKRACNHIEGENHALYDHLGKTITIGLQCKYDPDPSIDWSL